MNVAPYSAMRDCPGRVKDSRMTEVTENPSSDSAPATGRAFPPAHLALGRVFGALAGRRTRSSAASRRSRSEPHHRQFSRRLAPSRARRAADGAPRLARRTDRDPTIAAAATSSFRCPGRRRSTCSAPSSRGCATRHGPGAVFGGSYGWSSAGRFHHAQSQVHRFLNVAMGGYVRSVNTYSSGASSVLMPHIIGDYEDS